MAIYENVRFLWDVPLYVIALIAPISSGLILPVMLIAVMVCFVLGKAAGSAIRKPVILRFGVLLGALCHGGRLSVDNMTFPGFFAFCCSILQKRLRRFWYKLKRKKYMTMKFFDHFKWCIIGGFAYAAGRFLFNYLKDLV